jgi:phenol 2-monooxygenase (NADPH)
MASPEQLDVLIIGSGSAGITAALWLAIYNHQTHLQSPSNPLIKYKILERRLGPMTIGQADGVQCRTVEIFESLDLSEDLLREAYHVLEVAFWSPDGKGGIVRQGRAADTARGLSHMPHLILNQARINGLLLGKMKGLGGVDVEYGWSVKSVRIDEESAERDGDSYPCKVVASKEDGVETTFKAKYVLVSRFPCSLESLADRVRRAATEHTP